MPRLASITRVVSAHAAARQRAPFRAPLWAGSGAWCVAPCLAASALLVASCSRMAPDDVDASRAAVDAGSETDQPVGTPPRADAEGGTPRLETPGTAREMPDAVDSPDGARAPVEFEVDERLRDPLDPPEWTPLASWAGRAVEIRRELDPSGTKLMRLHTLLVEPDADPRGPATAHGPDWRYFENGFVARVEHWLVGQLDGPYRAWWPTGQLREEGAYVGGARVGPWRRHTRQGRLVEEGTYVAGEKDGVHRSWFADGQLEEEAGFRLGLQHGPLRRFGRDGSPVLEACYEDGVLHGSWSDHYAENGALRDFGAYERGLKTGTWRRARSDADGLLLEESYVAGQREGLQRTWDPSGVVVLERTFVAGAATGPTRSWYPDGTRQSEGELRDGQRVGPWTYWSPNGSVNERWTGTYADDVRVGP